MLPKLQYFMCAERAVQTSCFGPALRFFRVWNQRPVALCVYARGQRATAAALRLAAPAQERAQGVIVGREEAPQLGEGLVAHGLPLGTPPLLAALAADVPVPLPVEDKPGESTDAEESGEAAKGRARLIGEFIEGGHGKLRRREGVEPRTKLRLVERLADDARMEATRDCDALVPSFGRQPRGEEEEEEEEEAAEEEEAEPRAS